VSLTHISSLRSRGQLNSELDMADDFLLSFLHDAQSLVYGLIRGLEFVIGLCYFIGKSLSEVIVTSGKFLWTLSSDVASLLELIAHQILEVEQQIFRAVLLLYYGAGKIIDGEFINISMYA